MTRQEARNKHARFEELLHAARIREALAMLIEFQRSTGRYDFFDQVEQLTTTYKSLLHYATSGYHDPQQETILSNIITSLVFLGDEFGDIFNEPFQPFRNRERGISRHLFSDDPAVGTARIEEFFFHQEVNRLIDDSDLDLAPDRSVSPQSGFLVETVFKRFWLLRKYSPEYVALLQRISRSEQVAWHDKSLIVTAVTLSLLDGFDPAKFEVLLDFIYPRENQVYQRALTGIILCLIRYDDRLRWFPGITDRVRDLKDDENIQAEVEIILLQILMARETEKIMHEFETEVLPEMKKMMPKIEDKLQLNDLSDDELMEDKNPGWKDMIEEVPGLFEKIEKFSKMQMEGGDVFMSTFSQLKRFDFFNPISNWFVPFYRQHPEIRDIMPGKEEITGRLMESLEKAFYICNSDKYSFAINFRAIPEQQRTLILANFEAEFAQMKELASEEQLLDQSVTSNAVFIQYIQDLYRFYKLFSVRNEFDDVFQHNVRFGSMNFYTTLFLRTGFLERVAAFHFEKDNYTEAVATYLSLIELKGPQGEYYEKIGYCHQKSGRLTEAVACYEKAELFDTDRLWLYRKLGWCHMKLRNYTNALNYFTEAAKIQPDDLSIQFQAGQCLLNLKQFEDALHHYLKLRFFAPENLKVLRPIAWCYFVTGQLRQALETYAEIFSINHNPAPFDLLNAGHTNLCLGNRKEAFSHYRQGFLHPMADKPELFAGFDEDVPYLLKNGIASSDIPLIRDYLMFHAES